MVAITSEKPEGLGEVNEKHFPYGTSLSLIDDLADAVGFDNLKAGDVVDLRAKAFIKCKSNSEESEKGEGEKGEGDIESSRNLCIQLTDINLAPQRGDRAEEMYGK